jgi:hypothetical protein
MTTGYEEKYSQGRIARLRTLVRRYKDFITLATLVAFFVIYSILENTPLGNLFMVFIVNLFLLASLYSISDSPRQLAMGVILAIPSFLIGWIWYFLPSNEARISFLISYIVFLTYILLIVVHRILHAREVTSVEICWAVMVYVMIGLIFGMIYLLMEFLSGGSFMISSGKITLSSLFYFSFVALSTTGFGDIYAVAPMARSVVIIEMLVGVMYMAVLIGLLINAFRDNLIYKQ